MIHKRSTHTHTHSYIQLKYSFFCALLLTDTTIVKMVKCLRALQIEPTCTES